MQLLENDQFDNVAGGTLLLAFSRAALAAVTATDASMHFVEGFESGFAKAKEKAMSENGW